jgi:hypothetical protein
MALAAALLFTVRVRVIGTQYIDSYFDLTNIPASCDEEALGFAIELSTECFGLPLSHIVCRVRDRQPVIDC